MGEQASMRERSRIPLVLFPRDLQVVLDLASERAAREFVVNNGIPYVRAAGRIYVLRASLIAFMLERQERRETPAEARERADALVSQIAPTAAQRRRGRKPPEVDKE